MQTTAKIASTTSGPGSYRYTEPDLLEVNMFAGKKRTRQNPFEDCERSEERETYLNNSNTMQ